MAAIDSVASLAIATTERISKGTVYQHTHFSRPAVNDDFHVKAEVCALAKRQPSRKPAYRLRLRESWLRTLTWNSPSTRLDARLHHRNPLLPTADEGDRRRDPMSVHGTFSDMPTGRDDVRFRVKTGSYGQTGKMTRLTHSDNR